MADELTVLRHAIAAAQRAFEDRRQAVSTIQIQIDAIHESDLDSGTLSTDRLNELMPQLDAAKGPAITAAQALRDARTAYDAAVAAQAPLSEHDNGLPLLLLPVRIETVFRDGAEGRELWIRVYPDDVHVDAHEPGLTVVEREALADYRSSVLAAGDDTGKRDTVWRTLVERVGAARANWVLEAPPEAGPARERAWTRPAHTTLLPDRFVFSAYAEDGGLAWRHEGKDLPDTVPVAFAPDGEGVDGLPWDEQSRWLAHFDTAVELGLGIKVALDAGAESFALLTVVGVSTKQDGATGAARWQAALRAHRFTSELAVLPVGTPTNNIPATRSGWRSRPEPVPPEEIDRRRSQYDATDGQPAARAARAFGIDGSADLAVIPDALSSDDATITDIQRTVADFFTLSAVWKPLTATLVPPELLPRADIGFAVDHFLGHVRSRGVLPTLRIGRQPYGILPATSLDLWRGDDVDARIVEHVRSFLTAFEERAWQLPQVRPDGEDQDSVIIDLLSRQGTSPSVRVWFQTEGSWRGIENVPAAGSVPADSLAGRLPAPSTDGMATWEVGGQPTEETAKLLAQRPLRAIRDLLVDLYAQVDAHDFSQGPLDTTDFDARQLEADMGLSALTYAGSVPGVEAPGTVFYSHAGVVAEWAYKLCQDQIIQLSSPDPPAPPELAAAFTAQRRRVLAIVQQLAALEERVVADPVLIDRLVCEVLETLSHRVDSWATSLPAARLAAIRAGRPTGLLTGAYGWLTDVKRAEAARASDGYVITPSLKHAATAAVLRGGKRAHSDNRALAVDIQSSRIRRALPVIDAVRAGQPLAALLGYQLERALHEAQLDQAIAPLRATYPLAPLVEPGGPNSKEARVAIGARNVIDAQALRADSNARTDRAELVARAGGAITKDQADQVMLMIDDLDDTVDAIGDLLLAESVHHLVGGNPLRAGLSADAAGRAEDLPGGFEVVETPRGSAVVTHSVGILGAPAGAAPPPGWRDARPLAQLEPALEGWCRARLGSAAAWRFACQTADGQPADEVSLDQIGWCALDVLAHTAGAATAVSPLGHAIAEHLGQGTGLAADGEARVDELALVAGQLRGVLAAGTPMLATHLDPQARDPWASADLAELHGRISAWLAAVETSRTDLRARLKAVSDTPPGVDSGPRREAIRPALEKLVDLGVTAAFAPVDADLVTLGTRILVALDAAAPRPQRADVASLAVPAPPSTDAPAAERRAWGEGALARVAAILGEGLRVVPVLRGGPLAPPPEHAEQPDVIDWIRGVTAVRPRVRALDDALVSSAVIADAAEGGFHVTQTPASAAPWVATAAPDGRLEARASLVVQHDSAAQAATVSGLVIDTWSEGIPRRGAPPLEQQAHGTRIEGPEEIAGVAFNHDRPGACAPQALLLAVPPDLSRGWRYEDVHGTVEDTLRLAQVRGVDLDDLADLRTTLPIPTPDNF